MLLVAGMVLGAFHTAGAGKIDTRTFIFLDTGMSESEVLMRAGPPDLVSRPGIETVVHYTGVVDESEPDVVGIDSTRTEFTSAIKRYHYIPGPNDTDPYLTIITFRGGLVWDIERKKVFTRPKYGVTTATPAAPPVDRPTDEEIRVQRADATLKAAEEYAEIRARLKQAGREETAEPAVEAALPTEAPAVYRETRPDGTTYYGDVPATHTEGDAGGED